MGGCVGGSERYRREGVEVGDVLLGYCGKNERLCDDRRAMKDMGRLVAGYVWLGGNPVTILKFWTRRMLGIWCA